MILVSQAVFTFVPHLIVQSIDAAIPNYRRTSGLKFDSIVYSQAGYTLQGLLLYFESLPSEDQEYMRSINIAPHRYRVPRK